MCVTREFYDAARRLTIEHDSMLLVDSIQAGIRGQGCLSVIDYEGFSRCRGPRHGDMVKSNQCWTVSTFCFRNER